MQGVEIEGEKIIWDTQKQPIKSKPTAFHSIWDAEFKKDPGPILVNNTGQDMPRFQVVYNKELTFIKFSLVEVKYQSYNISSFFHR